MGIKNLQKVINRFTPDATKTRTISCYKGKTIAIDTSILIYQFVIAIRNSGADLVDNDGKMVSHIYAILSKAIGIVETGVIPIFVFDGKPPEIKHELLKSRRMNRSKAMVKMNKATTDADKIKYFKRSVVITWDQMNECKEVLELLGFPVIEAPEEADAQCAELVKSGIAWATATEDMDLLTFGSTRILRNFTSKAKHNSIIEIDLERILCDLNMTYNQFIDLCILLGSDYSCKINGIGVKSAVEIIRKYSTIDEFLNKTLQDTRHETRHETRDKVDIPKDFDHKTAREYFINPVVKNIDTIPIIEPAKLNKLRSLLVSRYNFSQRKVNRIVSRLKRINSNKKPIIKEKIRNEDFTRKNLRSSYFKKVNRKVPSNNVIVNCGNIISNSI